VLVEREGRKTSVSTVGRILVRLKARGLLRVVPRRPVSVRRHRLRREYAVRKPKGYAVEVPSDVVQVDTLDVRPLPGVAFKQFTARDTVSRWDVIQAHQRATAKTATAFLEALEARMPFPVKAIKSMGAASSRHSSNRPAPPAASACLFSRRVPPNWMVASNEPTERTGRVL